MTKKLWFVTTTVLLIVVLALWPQLPHVVAQALGQVVAGCVGTTQQCRSLDIDTDGTLHTTNSGIPAGVPVTTSPITGNMLPTAALLFNWNGANWVPVNTTDIVTVTMTGSNGTTDLCQGALPTLVAISQTSDTTLITASGGKKNYICSGLLVVDNSSGATETVNVIEGTGSGCVTTQTAAIMGSTTEANGMKITGNGFSISKTIPGSGTNVNTCLMQVGTQRISGYITYIQQ